MPFHITPPSQFVLLCFTWACSILMVILSMLMVRNAMRLRQSADQLYASAERLFMEATKMTFEDAASQRTDPPVKGKA
jgi:ATP-dependent Zn protease